MAGGRLAVAAWRASWSLESGEDRGGQEQETRAAGERAAALEPGEEVRPRAPRAVRGGAGGLAVLRAYPFRVPARGVLPLAYVARAQGAPLGDAGSAAMEAALRDGVVPFRVDGEAQTQWKVAGIVGVDQWTRLACQLRFFWPNGTVLPFRCISKSKFLFF
ncbi:late embryogenesis abundant protein [Zea mays]|uniref:Late embryogenesis abundant protein n=1 Tax=Zea mays TaxID=4577 RepID=A0A1D6ENT1_MAIZE|nr:late embryogenesis abundant protein [Zea mays]